MKYDVPIGMEITFRVGCPNICTYCPQARLLKAYKGEREFTLDSFKRCIEGGEVPVTRNLTFMGFSEPFMAKDCTKMITWAMKERGHGGSWSTTLRGATHDDIDKLAELDPTDTVVHVPANDGRMNLEPDDHWLDLFKHAIAAWRHHREFVISVFGIAHPKVKPIWEASGIPVVNFGLHDRAGQIPWLHHTYIKGPLPLCSKRWCGHLLPNGDVCRCCTDYGLENVWGNLNTQKYMDLYRSEKFREYMKACGSESDDVPCRHCTDGYRQTNNEHKHLSYENPCP